MSSWTGAGDGTSWTDPNNWSPVGIPPSFQGAVITQVGLSPVSVLIAAGQSEAANPLTLGAAGTSEAVTLTNKGTFTNYAGVTVYAGTTLANTNSMTLNGEDIFGTQTTSGFQQVNGNVVIESTGTVDSKAGGYLGVSGTIGIAGVLRVEGSMSSSTGLTGTGQVLVDGGSVAGSGGGALTISGGTFGFALSLGGVLNIAPPTAGDSFSFGTTLAGSTTTLIIPSYSGNVTSPITGFGKGDEISTGASGTVVITPITGGYSVKIGALTIANLGVAPGITKILVSSGNITAACYRAGTSILTDAGELPVEDLRVGDRVVTVAGPARPIRWIGQRHHTAARTAEHVDLRPVVFRAGALGAGLPRRDLHVSPRHAMLIDGVLVPAMHLVNGLNIEQPAAPGEVTYFHIELDSHDAIFAEGAPAETFRDESSADMFDNASTRLLPAGATSPCAPIVEDGFALEEIRVRIDSAAAHPRHEAATRQPGALRGHVDTIEPGRITGWAQDLRFPDVPVCLTVHDGATLLGRVLANRPRAGLGAHGFELVLPAPLSAGRVTVRRESDGAILRGSPGVWLTEPIAA